MPAELQPHFSTCIRTASLSHLSRLQWQPGGEGCGVRQQLYMDVFDGPKGLLAALKWDYMARQVRARLCVMCARLCACTCVPVPTCACACSCVLLFVCMCMSV